MLGRGLRSILLGVILSGFLMSPAMAGAEPSEADKTHARSLMDEGDALVEKHDLAAALGKYRQAHEIMGVTSTGIEVARTLAAMGRLREARQMAKAVAAIVAHPNEPEALARARSDAVALTHELDARIPQLTITTRGVAEGASVRVKIDGKAVPSDEIESPQLVDPGPHEISGASGSATTSTRVVLKERDRQTVTLTFPSESAGSSETPGEAPEPAPSPGGKSPTLGYVVGGIGIAGLAVAGVTSVIIVKRNSDIQNECPDHKCTAHGIDLVDGQKPLLVVNAIAWGVGLVGTGLGAYFLLSSNGKEQTAVGPQWTSAGPTLSLRRTF